MSKNPNVNVPSDSQIELTVEKLIPGGEGMARHEGKVIFIADVLPGERVRARIYEAKKDFARARLLEVLSPSQQRQQPPCPVAGVCGGCDWQHLQYKEQLRQKVSLTLDALWRTGGISFPHLQIESGKPLGYRNRMQFHQDPLGCAGFLARGSHDLVPVNACPVMHPALNALLMPKTTEGGLVVNDKNKSIRFTERYPAWAHSRGLSQKDFLISGEAGSRDPGFTVNILGRELHFDLRCFFQSNLDMLEKLIPYLLQDLAGNEAMDLYCGVGLFGAFLRDHFNRIIAVEENAVALKYARKNIGQSQVFLQGRLEDLVSEREAQLHASHPEVIVVDPPRPGLDATVLKFLIEKAPQALIYVSCNPVTLARDLKILLASGFHLEDLRLFDFYPQTAHVEAVAKLKKG